MPLMINMHLRRVLQRIEKKNKRQGGIIQMDEVINSYLISKHVAGITLNENTI